MSVDKNFVYRGFERLNTTLANRYADRYAYDLAKRVAADATNATRTATQLQTMLKDYEHVLASEQLLSLRAGVNVATRLAADLKALKPWAKAYGDWAVAKREREQQARDDARALQRWPDDQAALQEARQLLAFLDPQAQADILAYFVALFAHEGVTRAYLHVRLDRDVLERAVANRDMGQVRRVLLAALDRYSFGGLGESYTRDGCRFVGESDYRAWCDTVARSITFGAAGKSTTNT